MKHSGLHAEWIDGSPPRMWSERVRSFDQFHDLGRRFGATMQSRRTLEARLAEELADGAAAHLPAFCHVCRRYTVMRYDRLYAGADAVNWRERLVCSDCGLNNRLRLSVDLLDRLRPARPVRPLDIYATEHVTPLGQLLARREPGVVLSEFLGPDHTPGAVSPEGILHQDVTALTFTDASFDVVLSFDVLEHVPDYRAALREFCRVLKPDGTLILSAPFAANAPTHLVRARLLEGGRVEHLLPPEYHGDPVNAEGGVLCYYHFGWTLLDELREVGFGDAYVSVHWSLARGHIGPEQLIIVATRRRRPLGDRLRSVASRQWERISARLTPSR